MGAIFEADSSHIPMLSQPGFALDVIRKAVRTVQNVRLVGLRRCSARTYKLFFIENIHG